MISLFLMLFGVLGVIGGSDAHDGDPKLKAMEPSIPGSILSGNDENFDAPWGEATDGTIFCSQIPVNMLGGTGNASDLWHHVSPSEREYAIVTTKQSVAWVEVTDPFNPEIVHIHPRGASSSTWGDVKTIGEFAFVDGEGGGGVQIFDMTAIDSGVVEHLGAVGSGSAHNIVSVPEAGIFARVGGSVRFFRVTDDPLAPDFLGQWSERYVHDARIIVYPADGPDEDHRGEIIGFLNGGFNGGYVETGISIVSFGTPDEFNPDGTLLSHVTWPDAGFSHQCWESDDLRWLYSNDETSSALNSTWQCVDITDLDAAVLGVQQANGRVASNHNVFAIGGLLYAANYRDGVRVFARSGNDLEEIASFDTYPPSDSAGYAGCWGVDPFLPSGTILASDMQSGLFMFRLNEVENEVPRFEYPLGVPGRFPSEGGSFEVAIVDFEADSVRLEYEMESGDFGSIAAIPGDEAGRYTVVMPSAPQCPDGILFGLYAIGEDGELLFDIDAPTRRFSRTRKWFAKRSTVNRRMAGRWGLRSDTAEEGAWTRRIPSEDDLVGPFGDLSADGHCFTTGGGSGDVDGGFTTLVAPSVDSYGLVLPALSYRLWTDFEGVTASEDRLEVEISFDEGVSWYLVDVVTRGVPAWSSKAVVLEPAAAPNTVNLRFTVFDLGPDSKVVVAIDQLELVEWGCDGVISGDMNGDARVDGEDFGQFLIQWGTTDSAADFNFDGTVDGVDLGILLGHWTG